MKPFTSKHMFGAGSSPLKQSKRDSKEVEAYKQELAAAKDKRVKKNAHNIEAENKKGYSKQRIDINKKLVAKGTGSHGGASVNYKTGETKIADFPNKYVKGGTYDRVFDTKTGKMVAQAGASKSSNDVQRASKDYLDPKNRGYYNNESMRRAFVKDSINDREDKEIRLQNLVNRKNIAMKHGGMQESEIGNSVSGEKKAVKKKSPLKQFIDPEAKKREQERRNKMTVSQRKMEGTSMAKGPNRDSMGTSKKTTATVPGTAGITGRRIPLKMKKC
jgi:hypothetical protein